MSGEEWVTVQPKKKKNNKNQQQQGSNKKRGGGKGKGKGKGGSNEGGWIGPQAPQPAATESNTTATSTTTQVTAAGGGGGGGGSAETVAANTNGTTVDNGAGIGATVPEEGEIGDSVLSAERRVRDGKCKALVVDTGALIKGARLDLVSEAQYTVPAVLEEVRDPRTRRALKVLPTDLIVREPTRESLARVIDFARETGDYASLSATDIQVIALSVTLMEELGYGYRIRAKPRFNPRELLKKAADKNKQQAQQQQAQQQQAQGGEGGEAPSGATVAADSSEAVAAGEAKEGGRPGATETSTAEGEGEGAKAKANAEAVAEEEEEEEAKPKGPPRKVDGSISFAAALSSAAGPAWGPDSNGSAAGAGPAAGGPADADDEEFPPLGAPLPPYAHFDTGVPHPDERAGDDDDDSSTGDDSDVDEDDEGGGVDGVEGEGAEGAAGGTGSSARDNMHVPLVRQPIAEDDDEGEWITPENFEHKLKGAAATKPPNAHLPVAVMTTDFSMQNVILQMNLGLLSVDGLVVKSVKTFVLRCYSCAQLEYDTARLFCGRCGNHTMRKTAVSVNKKGNVRIHDNGNWRVGLRGTQHNIPRNRGGRGDNLILTEDAMWRYQSTRRKRRDKHLDVFGDDMTHFDAGKVSKTSRATYNRPVLGFGNRNVNAPKKYSGRKKRTKH